MTGEQILVLAFLLFLALLAIIVMTGSIKESAIKLHELSMSQLKERVNEIHRLVTALPTTAATKEAEPRTLEDIAEAIFLSCRVQARREIVDRAALSGGPPSGLTWEARAVLLEDIEVLWDEFKLKCVKEGITTAAEKVYEGIVEDWELACNFLEKYASPPVKDKTEKAPYHQEEEAPEEE